METKDLYIMSKDTPVLCVNFSEGKYQVLDENKLPFGLKGRLREEYPEKESYTRYDIIQIQNISNANNSAVTSWLANRVLLLSRANAKWLYNALKVEQVQTDAEKAKIALMCRAVSINDAYWVKLEGENICWDDVNIRTNPLNEIVAQIALHGKSLTLQGSLCSPEFTTNGAYAKAWRRHADGELWLHKKGDKDTTEARIEVIVSNLLDKTNVPHCHYEAGEDEGVYVCMCPAMSTENVGILSGMDFVSYCNVNGLNPDMEMKRIDSDMLYKMWIVDYLVSNRDRHGQNWGFFYNLETMEILGMHPLFDHNNAFDSEWMQNKDADYQFGNMTVREAARYAMKHTDFHFTEEITRKDFITDRQYNSFVSRAKELGIQVIREVKREENIFNPEEHEPEIGDEE